MQNEDREDGQQRLKQKYRNRPYSPGGKCKTRTGNSHGPTPKRPMGSHLKPRKKAYGPF